MYKKIVEAAGSNTPQNNLSNLLYIWQIFLRQMENIKMAAHPEQVLNASIVIMSHTSSFPDINKLIIKNLDDQESQQEPISEKLLETQYKKGEQENTNKLVQDILSRFPGSSVTEIL
jgi:hypothetical protein